MNILLIEDEYKIAACLKKGLEEDGHNVTLAYDGSLGLKLALEENFDLVILDVVLPFVNGFDLCRDIKQFRKDTPVLMLSSLGSVNDIVKGLENGADDYITKPFHFAELLARIKALDRRRFAIVPERIFKADDLQIDCYRKTVVRNGNSIALTVKEFNLLEVLLYNKNRVISRVYIAEAVWGIDFDRGTNLIDVYINYLRSKIDKGYSKQLIHTVFGMGYMLRDN
jgi:two-component system copper resistance phosphate regulon response regulator CusR